jgi:uncharacterized protein YceH (UPF0502 family)
LNVTQAWQPIGRVERRVLGVLVEKAKTTPDAYPLTLAALMTGCNQKSNRSPLMQLSEGEVEDAVSRLRELGAVLEVQGSGRVPRIRHQAYDWLGVSGAHAAIMTELMLRGPQTAGDIRGRASRMESLPDLTTTHRLIDELIAKGLVAAFSPPGRGQLFGHTLYLPEEQDKVREQANAQAVEAGRSGESSPERTAPPRAPTAEITEMHEQLEQLRELVKSLSERVANLEAERG